MAPTPRPEGWQGGSEDFDFLRTFDGHRAADHYATGDADKFGGRNDRDGFDSADIGGSYGDA